MLAKIPIVLSRARHTRLPFNRAAAIYRLRSMGCQGVRARIEHLETSLNFTEIGARQARSFLSILPPRRVNNYALCPLQEVLLTSRKVTCSCMAMRWFARLSPYFVKR